MANYIHIIGRGGDPTRTKLRAKNSPLNFVCENQHQKRLEHS